MKRFRTAAEEQVGREIERIFAGSGDPIEVRLENFPKYVRRQHLKRFLALYELFKLVLNVKGSIIDCGVFRGFSFMSWAKLSAMLEPENLTRRVYGFDTFAGFPSVSERDRNVVAVRVDNSRQPNSRWYPGSGIYRHVRLVLTEPVHITHWGTYVTTPQVSNQK